jgi:hypothetical protein
VPTTARRSRDCLRRDRVRDVRTHTRLDQSEIGGDRHGGALGGSHHSHELVASGYGRPQGHGVDDCQRPSQSTLASGRPWQRQSAVTEDCQREANVSQPAHCGVLALRGSVSIALNVHRGRSVALQAPERACLGRGIVKSTPDRDFVASLQEGAYHAAWQPSSAATATRTLARI